jgi:hypothetical protein
MHLPFSRSILLVAALVLTLAGCDCEGRGLKGAGPRIAVDPSSVAVEGVPGRITEVTLRVSNTGTGALVFAGRPSFVEQDGDGVEEFGIASMLERSCDEQVRPENQRDALEPGGCGIVVMRYRPAGDGEDPAELHFVTNDADVPDYVVPINAGARTPVLEICSTDGAATVCGAPGGSFDVDFGSAAPGSVVKRTILLRSKGTRPLSLQGLNLTGDADFAIDPADLVKTLAPGESAEVAATFTPDRASGGLRGAQLVVSNDDPRQGKALVNLVAVGEAPRLCFCVGSDGERCTPTATADFGKVDVGATAAKYLRLQSCGEKPLTLKRLEVTSGGPVFAVQAPSLGAGRTLAPGDRLPDVPLAFAPPAEDKFLGRLEIETDVQSGYVGLVGEGGASGCKLEAASPVLDFGQVAVGSTGKRDYTLANRGTVACEIPSAPVITAGAAVAFGLENLPTSAVSVAAGATVKFTVTYRPADATGPDEGEMSIGYGAAGSVAQLKVALKGTPAAQAKCVLTALPGTGNNAASRRLNFGQVLKGTEKVLPVTFQNVGSAECRLNSWRVTSIPMPGLPNDANYFKVKQAPQQQLAPGQSTILGMAFTPDAAREFGSPFGQAPLPLPFPGGAPGLKIEVTTSDTASFNGATCSGGGAAGCVGWEMLGQGVESSLRVLPSDLDFGKVTLGCQSRELKVTIYNTGRATLNIKSFRVDPPAPPAPGVATFRVRAPPIPAGGLPLTGGSQMSISVVYRPPDAAIHTGTLFIESDATNVQAANPYVTVGLKGEGTTESRQVDTFDQSARPKTDVLFVVDNSGSMGEEQGRLGDNASTFLNVAQQLNTDFQVGVVTTDVTASGQSGKLQTTGGLPKITANGPSAASNLRSIVRSLGTNGDSDERGLDAMVAALSVPLVNDPAANAGFLRPDAKLAVVVVSDEEDGSNSPVDFYVDFLKNLKGQYNSALVSFSAIVGDASPSQNSQGAPGCTSPDGDAVSGDRYIAVANRTGGKVRSICSANWGQIAADLGLDAFASRSGFPLSRPADPASIQVKVNGQPSPAGRWTFDAAANTVVFSGANLPPAGAVIVIEYEALCL